MNTYIAYYTDGLTMVFQATSLARAASEADERRNWPLIAVIEESEATDEIIEGYKRRHK